MHTLLLRRHIADDVATLVDAELYADIGFLLYLFRRLPHFVISPCHDAACHES